jgi:DNA-binding YbaB/EbfC family protein
MAKKPQKPQRSGMPGRAPGGMGGGIPGGMGGNLMAQVRKMQEDMEKAQAALAEEQVTGSAGGGMVEVVMDGHQNVSAVRLKPEVVDPDDVEMLQDLLLAAINDASQKAKALAEDRMGGVTGGLDLPPGLF